MILDAQNSFSRNQAVTGATTSGSTDVIDLSQVNRQIGVGEQLYLVVNVKVAAGGTTPTMAVLLQTDDNSSFSSATTVFTGPTLAAAALTAGAQFVYQLPITGYEQYLRAAYTLGGTSPTITVDAHLVTAAQLALLYPGGFTVQ